MQNENEDKELRGIEEKLSHLKPRGIDEPYLGELMESLDRERNDLVKSRNEGGYPPNVLWARFAPVAAAAGVVLLGTFFLRYESQMGALQSQRMNSTSTGDAMAHANKVSTGGSAGIVDPQLVSLPVPRLGMSENYTAAPVTQGQETTGLLPVSVQNYLQPVGEVFSDLNRGVIPNTRLHFEDAYDWQDSSRDTEEQKPAVNTQ